MLAVVRLVELVLLDGFFLLLGCVLVPVGDWKQRTGSSLVLASVAAFLAALIVTRAHCSSLNGRSLALRLPRLSHVLLVLLLVAPLALLATEASNWTAWWLGWQNSPQGPPSGIVLAERPVWLESVDKFYLALAQLPWGVALLVGCVLPGLGEELFFRGFLGRGLVARHGAFLGVLFTSVLFGLMHIDPVRIAATTVLGIALHVVYLTTRSFWAPVLLHTLNNVLADAGARLAMHWHFDLTGQYDAVHLSPLLTFAALGAVAVLIAALVRTRTRWLLADGATWTPGYVSAESPPPSIAVLAGHCGLGRRRGLGLAGVYLGFAVLLGLTLLSDVDTRRANHLLIQADNHLSRGDLDEAIRAYDEAILLAPGNADAHYNRALAYSRKNRLQRALVDLDQAILLDPQMSEAHGLRGEVHHNQGDLDAALADYSEAIRLKPDNLHARHNRGTLLLHKGEVKKAIDDLSVVVEHAPDRVEARIDRAEAYRDDGQYTRAAADLYEALRRESDNARACRALAWLRGACPQKEHRNGPEAVELARRACLLGKEKEAAALAALACACAECGDFEDAVRWQQKAIALAAPHETENYEAFLDLYRNRKPYRLSRR
jgi:membrane protease YdiL (CAAX protease family)/tetratricopeptide (TPR) repeat protein